MGNLHEDFGKRKIQVNKGELGFMPQLEFTIEDSGGWEMFLIVGQVAV